MEKQYPYQILLEGAPVCDDLQDDFDCCLADGEMSWWEEKTPLQVISALQEIHDRYEEGSGWTWAEDENAKEHQKPIKKVLAHVKRRYKKYYKGGK
tara:strand:- start:5117 stop:5404 length:288 start_codon:yes stop_codon:yes gene_type:complete